MKVTIVEGTPAELAEALPGLFAKHPAAAERNEPRSAEIAKSLIVKAEQEQPNRSAETLVYVPKKLAQATLRRLPLAPKVRVVLKEIYSAYPCTVSAASLQEKIAFSTSQFAGLMGAFGRRLANTPGFEPGMRFFAQEWDHELGCFRYGLPDVVREAVAEEPWAKMP